MDLSKISDELDEGMKIQKHSVSFLNFIVQNMLDYAQIREGKFRKNISRFNLKQCIKGVMDM